MNELAEIISKKGSIPFSEFMNLALYHPIHGYYTSKLQIFGTRGDFYTSPGVHSVFAETLAYYIWERCRQMFPEQKSLHIIELGAGNGRLAEGILRCLTDQLQLAPEQFTYTIVEVSEKLQLEQKNRLQPWSPSVFWATSLDDLQETCGFLLSNELLDAFPVDIVMRESDIWKQKWVDWNPLHQIFEETWKPIEDPELQQSLAHLNEIGEYCECEINRGLKRFVEDVNRVIRSGFVLTIDYGGESDELFGPHHPHGTVRSFVNHRVTGDVLENPGQQDITADVDFTYFETFANKYGWIREKYERQGSFLVHAGILNRLQNGSASNPFDDPSMKRNMAIKHLILPGGMGDAFRVTLHRLSLEREPAGV